MLHWTFCGLPCPIHINLIQLEVQTITHYMKERNNYLNKTSANKRCSKEFIITAFEYYNVL